MNLKTKVSSRRFLLLLAMLSATTFAIAQNFTGRIIDEQSQPMPFANVVLVNRADSAFVAGAVTKDDGTFSISTDKQYCLLKVSSVGYILMYIDARQGSSHESQYGWRYTRCLFGDDKVTNHKYSLDNEK